MSDHPTTPTKTDGRHAPTAEMSAEYKPDGAMGRLGHEMDALRAEALPRMSEAMASAENYGRERIAALREGARDWQHRAENLGASTTSFVRHRPVQSMLIAAASGAALMGLVSLLARNRRH
jgi:ElaB/YqjD/DUF883 family membrane-anchored ribosome-binding protein